MSFEPRARRLYARQMLLPEIGPGGQALLCAARFTLPATADPRAARVAEEYLLRAGLRRAEPDAADTLEPSLPTPAEIGQRAGHSALEDARAALEGALAAVETIKAALTHAPSPD